MKTLPENGTPEANSYHRACKTESDTQKLKRRQVYCDKNEMEGRGHVSSEPWQITLTERNLNQMK